MSTQTGIEPATFWSPVRRSNHWATRTQSCWKLGKWFLAAKRSVIIFCWNMKLDKCYKSDKINQCYVCMISVTKCCSNNQRVDVVHSLGFKILAFSRWHISFPVVMWCDVMWCGVVWCGVVWCGVVWCGVLKSKTGERRMEEYQEKRLQSEIYRGQDERCNQCLECKHRSCAN